MALTELSIRKLKPPKSSRREVYDRMVPGFGVRITDKGVRSFIYVYSSAMKKKRVRVTLGRVGEIDLETARSQARELRSLVRAGKIDEARSSTLTNNGLTSFRDVVDLYDKRVLVDMRSGSESRKVLDRELMPHWADKPITTVTRADVLERVEARVDAGAPEAARRLFEITRRLFNWAISRGTFGIEQSPCEKLRPMDIIGRKPSRTRILADNELRELWQATNGLGYPFAPMIRLLMLSGLRRNEVAEARWQEFDLDNSIWTIPAERMKSDAAHVVPLTTEMLAIITELPRIQGNEFLFTSRRHDDKPVSGFSAMKQRLDNLMDGKADWTLHDIRRTMRTHLSALPVPGGDLVRELLLAHTRPELHKVYDQHSYLEEKRQALELWTGRLMGVVG